MEGFESFIGVNFWTALFTLINTLAVFFCAKKFLFVPVKKMIDSRQKEIEDMYKNAGDAQKDAEILRAEYEEKLSEAQKDSDRIVREAVILGQAHKDEILRKADEDAAMIMAKASFDIDLERKKAINDVKDEIAYMAMAIASKVVERELSSDNHKQLIDSFIDELSDKI